MIWLFMKGNLIYTNFIGRNRPTFQLLLLKHFRRLFANIYLLLELFAVLPVSGATAERSFSVMKQGKTFLRNRTGDERLSSLALLSIHKELTSKLDPEKIVDEFAKRKRRIKLID